jgi:hypothetical protein
MRGHQCLKRLWWTVHESDAPELVPNPTLQARFEAGHRVGEAAQASLPGGVLIDLSNGLKAAAKATDVAMEEEPICIYEASFIHEGVFVAIDILERRDDGWGLIEVKSTGSVKPNHLLDTAIQQWVVESQGHRVSRTEVMHLNTQYDETESDDLFVRTDTTAATQKLQADIPKTVEGFRESLAGPRPRTEPGKQCTQPYPCEFFVRCNPSPPEHGLQELYRVKAKILKGLARDGIELIREIPESTRLPAIAQRQRQAILDDQIIIDPSAGPLLSGIQLPAVFIDFEAINPALPAWSGTRPFGMIPVQVSMHRLEEDGTLTHRAWLAPAGEDPRPGLALEVLEGVREAATLVAYHASFEQRVIRQLMPYLDATDREVLGTANDRFFDLLPLVRNHVYHPGFRGRFSLKSVIRALFPALHYGNLDVQSGDVASAQLEYLIVHGKPAPGAAREQRKQALLAYCERDTLVMVKLYQYLKDELER